MLGGVGSKGHRVLNRLLIGAKQHVGGGFPAVAGLDAPANGAWQTPFDAAGCTAGPGAVEAFASGVVRAWSATWVVCFRSWPVFRQTCRRIRTKSE
jgi:hypothetical protein